MVVRQKIVKEVTLLTKTGTKDCYYCAPKVHIRFLTIAQYLNSPATKHNIFMKISAGLCWFQLETRFRKVIQNTGIKRIWSVR
jgi:hypothetical protein